MAVLGEGGVIGHRVFKTQAAEPAVGQVEVEFLAKATFRPNAVAVAHDQHAQHQLGVDGRAANRAVVLSKVLAQAAEVKAAVDAAQQVVLRDVVFEIERVEEPILPARLSSHHLGALQDQNC